VSPLVTKEGGLAEQPREPGLNRALAKKDRNRAQGDPWRFIVLRLEPGIVTHAYNPSYLGGRDRLYSKRSCLKKKKLGTMGHTCP
jgi:hypothetical protein